MKYFAVVCLALALASVVFAQDEQESGDKSLTDALRKQLENTVASIKDRVDNRREKADDLIQRASELVERLRQLGGGVGDTVMKQIDNQRERARDIFAKLRERIAGRRDRRDLEAVKKALEDIRGGAKDRFAELADWLRKSWTKGRENMQTQRERVTELAKDVRDHAKEMRQGAVRESVEALRPFKAQLGDLWQEVLNSAKGALGRKPSE